MLCKNPFMRSIPHPCGQCNPCRINRRRIWTHRILLESDCHSDNGFLTLTYAPETLPLGGTLVPRDLELFWKRLRKRINPLKVRYYAVGEYGDQSERPHYHAALFGLGPSSSEIVQSSWHLGHSMVGDLNVHSAQYIAGYVVKKMTNPADSRLNGRYPEFSRISSRPGIGGLALESIMDVITNPYVLEFIRDNGDIPYSLKRGGKSFPIDRYIRRKIYEALGIDDETRKEKIYEYTQELSVMLQDALVDEKNASKGFKQILIEQNAPRVSQIEGRFNIYKSRSSL